MRSVVVLLALAAGVYAQQFPAVEGETLAGNKVELPGAFGAKPTVVIVGFTHASHGQTEAWGKRLRGQVPDWSIAVLQDVPRLVRGMAVHGIKGSVPKEEYGRFVVVYKGEKELKDAAGFSAPDDAYLMIVDGAGGIRWRFHGAVSDAAVEQLRSELAK